MLHRETVLNFNVLFFFFYVSRFDELLISQLKSALFYLDRESDSRILFILAVS